MTVDQMVALFRRHGVPADFFVTDGSLCAPPCLGIAPDGFFWQVYQAGEGCRAPLSRHATEGAAVRDMLRRVDARLAEAGLPRLPPTD